MQLGSVNEPAERSKGAIPEKTSFINRNRATDMGKDLTALYCASCSFLPKKMNKRKVAERKMTEVGALVRRRTLEKNETTGEKTLVLWKKRDE